MPTHITQDDLDDRTVLRVRGEMTLEDALLLEKIALPLRGTANKKLVIDLADLTFLDSESAGVLKRMRSDHQITIEGIEIFLQTAVNTAERNSS